MSLLEENAMQGNRASWWIALPRALGGGQPMAQASPPPACTAVAHRQFEFWLGRWTVHGGPDGKALQGSSRIERSDNGCWIFLREVTAVSCSAAIQKRSVATRCFRRERSSR
jgi:hypothetical protein